MPLGGQVWNGRQQANNRFSELIQCDSGNTSRPAGGIKNGIPLRRPYATAFRVLGPGSAFHVEAGCVP